MFFLSFLVVVISASAIAQDIYYDTFTGNNITTEELQNRERKNLTFWCVGSYKPCEADEVRRVDATCNNLRYPHMGGPHTPSMRDLPAQFSEDIKHTLSGEELPLARVVRMESLINGDVPDQKFTAIVPSFIAFVISAFISVHDFVNYVIWNPDCCEQRNKKSICAPLDIPANDTVHQFSNIRCMGLTKPLTYQNLGCTRNGEKTPERINSASNFLDLTFMYGFTNNFRTMDDGLLQYDVEDGNIWPVGTDKMDMCLNNAVPKEKRCHKFDSMNTLMGENFFGIMFWRLHNIIARELKKVNPHWSDDKLFFTAKDINIALSNEIYYYELSSDLMGKKNLLRDGVLSANTGFRDLYDETLKPQHSTEYLYALRWMHTMQPGLLNQYDSDGNYLSQIATTELTARTGWFAVDNNYATLTQSLFRDPMAKVDHVVDPFISEKGLFPLPAFDLTAVDLQKGHHFGIAPYIKYRELCTGKKYKTFEDLLKDIKPENIEIIKRTQKRVEDIPLMLGLWMEETIPGGHLPKTLYCLSMRQMKRFMQYDRHWYERPNRPAAFTNEQLSEIRKASIAWVLCTAEPYVTQIQPRAFLREGPKNKFTSCKNIKKINFEAWKETNTTSSNE